MTLLEKIDGPADLKSLSDKELQSLAQEVRELIIDTIGEVGGHFGANLGTCELAVALHSLIDSPHDKVLWDVGHQAYPHKILTGRRDRLNTIRKYGGLAPFCSIAESEHDIMGAGHASTSVSYAVGIKEAMRQGLEPDGKVVAVIGDGALTGGVAFEALHNAGGLEVPIVIVLNDNGMSIAPNVGALSRYFNRIRLQPDLYRAREAVEAGLTKTAAAPAEPAPPPQYTSVFGKALVEECRRDRRICGITAAMNSGTGLNLLQEAMPERYYDVGIAEQHAVLFAAGLALGGMKPVAAIYSTFLQRAYDQIVHDVCLQKLNVVFAMDRAGLVGDDGPTHHGAFDIAYMRCLPNIVLMAPRDEAMLVDMLRTAVTWDDGPIALRYPRGEAEGVPMPSQPREIEVGRGEVPREGDRVALLGYGFGVPLALRAAEQLAENEHDVTVAVARFAKPLDAELIATLVAEHDVVMTIEDGVLQGGFGAGVAEHLVDRDLAAEVRLLRAGLPDRYVTHGKPALLHKEVGLTPEALAERVLQAIGTRTGSLV